MTIVDLFDEVVVQGPVERVEVGEASGTVTLWAGDGECFHPCEHEDVACREVGYIYPSCDDATVVEVG